MFFKIRAYILIQLFLFLIIFTISSQDASNLEIGQTVYISSPLGLNMRDQPAITGNKVTALSFNSKISIIDINDTVQEIQGKTSKWISVRYNGKIGWIFGGFVANQIISDYDNDFRYYLSNGRSESYSIHIGMKLTDAYNILGTPIQTVGFMGQQVHIYKNPFLNIYGEKEVVQITWADQRLRLKI